MRWEGRPLEYMDNLGASGLTQVEAHIFWLRYYWFVNLRFSQNTWNITKNNVLDWISHNNFKYAIWYVGCAWCAKVLDYRRGTFFSAEPVCRYWSNHAFISFLIRRTQTDPSSNLKQFGTNLAVMSLSILGKLVEPIHIELRPLLIVLQSSRRGAYIFVSTIHTLIYMLNHIANSIMIYCNC